MHVFCINFTLRDWIEITVDKKATTFIVTLEYDMTFQDKSALIISFKITSITTFLQYQLIIPIDVIINISL